MAKKKGRGGPGFGDTLRDKVNESSAVPSGWYDGEVVDCEATTTRDAGKKMIHAELQVAEPKEWAGATLHAYMVFGSAEDPDAEDVKTLKRSRGVKQFRQLARCAGVLDDVGDDDEENCELLKGKEVGMMVFASIEEEGDFKDEVRDRITRFYPIGEHEASVTEELPGTPAGKKSVKDSVKKAKPAAEEEEDEPVPKAKKTVKAKPPPDDDDDDEDDDEEEEAPKKKGSKKEEEDDDEDDNEDDEEDEDEDPPKARRR